MSELEVRLIGTPLDVKAMRDHILTKPGLTPIEIGKPGPAKEYGHVRQYLKVDMPDE